MVVGSWEDPWLALRGPLAWEDAWLGRTLGLEGRLAWEDDFLCLSVPVLPLALVAGVAWVLGAVGSWAGPLDWVVAKVGSLGSKVGSLGGLVCFGMRKQLCELEEAAMKFRWKGGKRNKQSWKSGCPLHPRILLPTRLYHYAVAPFCP